MRGVCGKTHGFKNTVKYRLKRDCGNTQSHVLPETKDSFHIYYRTKNIRPADRTTQFEKFLII